MSTKKQPLRVGIYLVLDAVRQVPPQFVLETDYPPLQPVGSFMQRPVGSPKGADIFSVTDGPVEDIYTLHFVAVGTVEPDGSVEFEPEAKLMFDLLSRGLGAVELGKQLVEDVLGRVAEVVANETQASAIAWIADQRRKVARGS